MAIITDRHHRVFGEIVDHCAFIEAQMRMALSYITGAELRDIIILTAPHSAVDLCDAVESIVANYNSDQDAAEFRDHATAYRELSEIRRRIVYSHWAKGPRWNSVVPIGTSGRKSGETTGRTLQRDWTITDFEQVAEDARNLRARCDDWLRRRRAR